MTRAVAGGRTQDQLGLEVQRGGRQRVVVKLSGELDLAVAGTLQAALDAARPAAELVLLDLTALTFMDCAGIGVLVEEQQRAQADGYSVVVTGASGEVADLLALTGLDEQLGDADARWARRAPRLSASGDGG
jgi:anti-anti-sigma factor